MPGEVPPGSLRSLALGAAAWTIAYWAVRMPMITIADHPGAFKVVHAVLAVVSVGLGVWALMTLRSDRSRAALLQS